MCRMLGAALCSVTSKQCVIKSASLTLHLFYIIKLLRGSNHLSYPFLFVAVCPAFFILYYVIKSGRGVLVGVYLCVKSPMWLNSVKKVSMSCLQNLYSLESVPMCPRSAQGAYSAAQ